MYRTIEVMKKDKQLFDRMKESARREKSEMEKHYSLDTNIKSDHEEEKDADPKAKDGCKQSFNNNMGVESRDKRQKSILWCINFLFFKTDFESDNMYDQKQLSL